MQRLALKFKGMVVVDLSLKEAARRLNGEISGDQIVCPGPNHSPKDRSLSVKLTPAVRSGFLVYSHAGDDPMVCRDYVAEKLGLPKFQPQPNGNRFSLDVMVRAAMSAAVNDKSKAKPIAIYHYTDRDGTLLYQVLRYERNAFSIASQTVTVGYIKVRKGVSSIAGLT